MIKKDHFIVLIRNSLNSAAGHLVIWKPWPVVYPKKSVPQTMVYLSGRAEREPNVRLAIYTDRLAVLS